MMLDADLQRLCTALTSADSPAPDDRLVELARAHRVDLLLAHRAGERDTLRAAAAHALTAERDMLDICGAAHARGIDLLLLKGAALAYTHYPAPYLRPRADIDLLIRRRDLDAAGALLTGIGYTRAVEADADLWTGQRHYLKTPAAGPVMVDLHWRAANPIAFAEALAFDEVWTRSVAVPGLGPHARTLAPPDSLLLACLHRVAHHQDRVDLLWLWDIHLLVSRMTEEEFTLCEDAAFRARAARVCARGLELARECFATAVPADRLARLQAATDEPSAAFLGSPLSPFEVARADMAALSSRRARASLIREHLFPSAAYMRQRYSSWPVALLPIAYVHRMVLGAPRWLRR
jgi:hypothetical protein